MIKKSMWLLLLIGAGCALAFAEEQAVMPTGLVKLEDARYPVALLVPENYSVKQAYPLLVTIPSEGASPEDALAAWQSFSKRRSLIVLAPSNLRPEDLPTGMDAWILKIIGEVRERYKVDKDSIYLVGEGGGAHYAAYLAVQHPESFSAVALIGAAWKGRYGELIRIKKHPSEQLPFLLYAPADQPGLAGALTEEAYAFEKKGYPVTVSQVGSAPELLKVDFRKKLFESLEAKSRDWRDFRAAHSKSFKEQVRAGVKQFFTV